MQKHNPKNERIKRRYLAYLEEAKRLSTTSADQIAAAISLFEASTAFKDFAKFHIEQARRFKRLQLDGKSEVTGKQFSKATAHSRLTALRAFFIWLPSQPGYRKLSYADAEYFNLSANDSRIATANRERPVPSIEQIAHVMASIVLRDEIDRRDQALIAFTLVSGMRDNAIASLRLRYVDIDKKTVFQDARAIRTKNRKTFTSSFFPIGSFAEDVVSDWIRYLKTVRLFGPDDPLFPSTNIAPNGDGLFCPMGLTRESWATAAPIRRIFRERFTAAGLTYFNPHSFRKTLVQLGERMCKTPEEFKSWSQNLGHENVATTLGSYGTVAPYRQAEIFEKLREVRDRPSIDGDPDAATVGWVMDFLRRRAA